MKKTIQLAINIKQVVTAEKEVDLPETAKYFKKNANGRVFARGVVLFAIIPKYEKNPTHSYLLYEIERNIQNFTDFNPAADCKSLYWLNESGLRKTAFEIMSKTDFEFEEITHEEFKRKRAILLSMEEETHG